MNYQKSIITPPLPFDQDFDIDLGGKGDSYFINLVPYRPTPLNLTPVATLPLVPTPSVFLVGQHNELGDVVTEGVGITLTVKLSQDADIDTVVDWTVTHGGAVANEVFQDNHVQGVEDPTDYLTSFVQDTVDADFGALTGQVTVVAGTDEVAITITTVDDALLGTTYNSMRVATVTLTAVDNPLFTLNSSYLATPVILRDATAYPVYSGDVQVFFQSQDLLDYEQLLDAEGTQETISLGYHLDAASAVTDITTAGQVQIDDIPVDKIRFSPLATTPLDLNAVPEDLLTNLPYYRAIIQIGRRT